MLDFAGAHYVKVTKNITSSAGAILHSAGEFSCTNQSEIHGLKAVILLKVLFCSIFMVWSRPLY